MFRNELALLLTIACLGRIAAAQTPPTSPASPDEKAKPSPQSQPLPVAGAAGQAVAGAGANAARCAAHAGHARSPSDCDSHSAFAYFRRAESPDHGRRGGAHRFALAAQCDYRPRHHPGTTGPHRAGAVGTAAASVAAGQLHAYRNAFPRGWGWGERAGVNRNRHGDDGQFRLNEYGQYGHNRHRNDGNRDFGRNGNGGRRQRGEPARRAREAAVREPAHQEAVRQQEPIREPVRAAGRPP